MNAQTAQKPFLAPRMLSRTLDSIPLEASMSTDSGSGEESLEIDIVDVARDAVNHWLERNGERIMRDQILIWCNKANK